MQRGDVDAADIDGIRPLHYAASKAVADGKNDDKTADLERIDVGDSGNGRSMPGHDIERLCDPAGRGKTMLLALRSQRMDLR